ncbi:MAG TPA: TonB-dependent receptor, partial [Caulobacteraceae bacterium]|nr:TonB-dependent receptor [Caulobacteraceae bacterium]
MTAKRAWAGLLATVSVGAIFAGFSPAAMAAGAADDQSSVPLKEVVVTAPRKEVEARKLQFIAPNLINVQSAETILKYPDFNAAEALGRMPGVSISTDTGEGRFVNIRGIDGNLAGATFGGVPLLNTYPGGTYFGGGGRAVEYDTIPTGSIDGIIVTKTPLPDHEAESLGGTVELTPRTATDINSPFLDATAGWGYEPMHAHDGPLNLDAAVGVRFGIVDGHVVTANQASAAALTGFFSNPAPFSLVLTANWLEDRRGFDDFEEDYNDPTVDRSYADLQLRQYDYHRRRFGYGGEFDFQPNDDNAWYLRGNVAGYTESVKKNRLTYDDLGDTPNPSDPTGFATTTDITLASTDEQETHRNQVYVIGGRDDFSGVLLDYRASYSRATYDQSKNYGTKFTGPQALAFDYNNSANNGDFPALMTDFNLVNDPTQYGAIKKISNSTEFDEDQEYAYAANLQIPVSVFSNEDFIKIGGEARLRQKSSTPDAFTSAISPLSLADASGPATTNFYYNYTNGPNINVADVRAAYAAGVISGGPDPSSIFTAREDIYAGYGEYQAVFGKLQAIVGARVEATRALYGAYSDDNAAETLAFVERPENYTNVFPSVQLRYEIQPNMLLRAIYSTGIGRPGFLQNTASTSSNHDPTDPQISQGNPNLKPTT